MKTTTRKVVGLFTALSVIGAGFTVATPVSAASELVIWADKGTLDTIKGRVAAWDTANPEFTAKLVERDFGTVREVLKTAVPGGTGPDILTGSVTLQLQTYLLRLTSTCQITSRMTSFQERCRL
jgi:ABC-type glycerol-3-phosphate transport system substrate-binding protein